MILAIRTDSPQAELYLLDQQANILDKKIWEAGHELSKQVLVEIMALVRSQHKKLRDLTGVIVFEGPGSFTSLRIGISVANALADGLDIPVVATASQNWLLKGAKKLSVTKVGRPALPVYGRQPNITKPRK